MNTRLPVFAALLLLAVFSSGCVTRLVARKAKGYPSAKLDDISYIAGAWQTADGRWVAVLLEGEFKRPEKIRHRYSKGGGAVEQALWLIDRERLVAAGANIVTREYMTELNSKAPFPKPEIGLRTGLNKLQAEWSESALKEKLNLNSLEVPAVLGSRWHSIPRIDLRGIENHYARGEEMQRLAATRGEALFLMASAKEYAKSGNFFVVLTTRYSNQNRVAQFRVELDTGQIPPRRTWWLAMPFAAVWDVVVVFPYLLLMGILGGSTTSVAIVA